MKKKLKKKSLLSATRPLGTTGESSFSTSFSLQYWNRAITYNTNTRHWKRATKSVVEIRRCEYFESFSTRLMRQCVAPRWETWSQPHNLLDATDDPNAATSLSKKTPKREGELAWLAPRSGRCMYVWPYFMLVGTLSRKRDGLQRQWVPNRCWVHIRCSDLVAESRILSTLISNVFYEEICTIGF